MPTATATVTLDNFPNAINKGQHLTEVHGSIAISASPATYATGGLALSFAGDFPKVLNQTPIDVLLMSDATGLHEYGWNKANGKFQLFAASAAAAGGAVLEEFPNATAIPADVSGDTIRFVAWFPNAE